MQFAQPAPNQGGIRGASIYFSLPTCSRMVQGALARTGSAIGSADNPMALAIGLFPKQLTMHRSSTLGFERPSSILIRVLFADGRCRCVGADPITCVRA